MKTLKIAALGLTHDHVWENLTLLRQLSGVQLVGAFDSHVELRERFAREYSAPAFTSANELLRSTAPDAVLIFADNRGGAELACAALRHRAHVLIEKPMAADAAGARKILRVAKANRRRVMVNWPIAWWPQLQHALKLASDGKLGRLWQVRYRAAHAGPKAMGCSRFFSDWLYDPARNGAGAFMDYCCYGAALARVTLGQPQRVSAFIARLGNHAIRAEDNGLLLMHYPKALGISEGSWTQAGYMTSYVTVLYGTKGTLLVEPGDKGRLLIATAEQPAGVPVRVPPLPKHMRNAVVHFVRALRTGENFTDLCTAEVGRDTQEILEAGLKVAHSGHTFVAAK